MPSSSPDTRALAQEPRAADPPISARPDRPYSLALQDVDAEEDGESEEFEDYEAYSETTTETVFEEEDEPLLWKGFLYRDRHFRYKPRPIGRSSWPPRTATRRCTPRSSRMTKAGTTWP